MTAHTTNPTHRLPDNPRNDSEARLRTHQMVVPGRFCGPPGMGNGGWVSGSLAGLLPSGPVQVTLRAPAPLDQPLTVRTAGDTVQLLDGDTLCAEAATTEPSVIEIPAAVGLDAASFASTRFVGHHEHPFPTCFVCGPEREPDDALRIFPGPVDGRLGAVAAPWVPSPSLATGDSSGHVRAEAIWAALDCPTGWAHYEPGGVALLGRHTVDVVRPVVVGDCYVVVAQQGLVDGRKLHAAAALYAVDGTLHASARALWITLV